MNLEIILVRTVLVLTAALSVGISLWGGYYLLTGLMSWRRPMDYGRHPAGTRFAVLIAARNEELVIGPLINSLLEQEYPAELYDIYVIPNNCTDNTALGRPTVRGGGAGVHRAGPVKGGGAPLCGGAALRRH